ncbi:MAG: VOC family protein, partial [Xanthobacteraceae bacterium]
MSLQTLGYIGLRTKNLEDWTAYANRFLGMQLVDKRRGTASFRMDDRKQRLVVQESDADASGFFGWEVADAAALDAYAANLEKHKVPFARGSRALAEERKVRDLIVLSDPVGIRLEIFHGAATTTEPFKP